LTAGTTLQAKLFFLTVSATNEIATDNGAGTSLTGSLAFGLPSASGNKLTVSQFTAGLVGATVSANLAADVNLHLTAAIDPNLPSIATDLMIHFPIAAGHSGAVGGVIAAVSEPTVAFDNVTLNLGSFFSRIVQPIMTDINQVL